MKTYSLSNLVKIVKSKSPFYKRLYKNIKTARLHLSDLPVVDEAAFWKANSHKSNQLLTQSANGCLMRTGGTTGIPKASVYSFEEWRASAQIMASKLKIANLVRANDCVANMFASGSLYG